jgi:class 3 adenylate cyclase
MKLEKKARGGKFWEVRLGMHTGELVAGVIGKTKFAYDVWGNAVNLASRMESGGKVGKVNTSQFTYEIIKDFFVCTYRGEIEAKNIGSVKAYFVERILPELSADADGFVPNDKFYTLEKERFGA